ncbi:MAG: hypothetical protein HY820_07495 [Acidobacteria bacterium]|nr:hypothetical protein [Acidobacteriota bacterium]
MPYFLSLYTISEVSPLPLDLREPAVPDHLREHGSHIGEVAFAAGSSTALLESAGELAQCDLGALKEGEWRGFDGSSAEETYGSLSNQQVSSAAQRLRAILSQPNADAWINPVAQRWKLPPPQLRDFLERLTQVLEQCVAAGGEVVGLYS